MSTNDLDILLQVKRKLIYFLYYCHDLINGIYTFWYGNVQKKSKCSLLCSYVKEKLVCLSVLEETHECLISFEM